MHDINRLVTNSTNTGEVDIIFLSETWLLNSSPNVDLVSYNLEREDHSQKRGAGVGIYVSQGMKYHRISGTSVEH